MIKTYSNFYKERDWKNETEQYGGVEYTDGEVSGWAFKLNIADHSLNNKYHYLQDKCHMVHRSGPNSEYNGNYDE